MPFRPVLLLAWLLAATISAAAHEDGPVALDFTPLGTAAEVTGASAPMDVSFGIYPMSILGIESAIHRYDGTRSLDDGPIAYAIPAIRDWEHRFPHDPWIARELLSMERVYAHARTDEGDRYARAVAVWLERDYPHSHYTTLCRRDFEQRS
jgi:hypothetical protein